MTSPRPHPSGASSVLAFISFLSSFRTFFASLAPCRAARAEPSLRGPAARRERPPALRTLASSPRGVRAPGPGPGAAAAGRRPCADPPARSRAASPECGQLPRRALPVPGAGEAGLGRPGAGAPRGGPAGVARGRRPSAPKFAAPARAAEVSCAPGGLGGAGCLGVTAAGALCAAPGAPGAPRGERRRRPASWAAAPRGNRRPRSPLPRAPLSRAPRSGPGSADLGAIAGGESVRRAARRLQPGDSPGARPLRGPRRPGLLLPGDERGLSRPCRLSSAAAAAAAAAPVHIQVENFQESAETLCPKKTESHLPPNPRADSPWKTSPR
ncbi:translation initiation factor IF-2-like [Psammomys obesus]|uniref:translation initiation factor IF-2-like n=1 Tax=Psammomys obesus TaxID=48139 RepID=UPI0024536727|nr:translation initiation factor IF-2-like [Psammomys obesus]